jgi:polyhydroxyalkanoate synthesis regulator phasin
MSIPIESPPEGLSPEINEWLTRTITTIAGEFERQEQEITALEERVAKLESPTP